MEYRKLGNLDVSAIGLGWTLRILSSMSEGVCEWLIQRDREFLNVWASCGQ